MIIGQEVVIPIPKTRNTHLKLEINGTDMISQAVEAEFIKQATIGIGRFTAKLYNAKGQYSRTFAAGQSVKFYADNSTGTTLQFWGILDFVKDDISNKGQYLSMEGRHRSYLVTETLVNYTTTDKEISAVLEELISTFLSGYGFTHTNVNSTGINATITWNYKPFWDCVKDLCDISGFDCYVDDNLDFHFFQANSIFNTAEGIIEGQNFIETKGWGTDTYYQKTRVAAMGQDDQGLPILYTAVDAAEGSTIRKFFIKDTSANTLSQVQAIAEAKLAEVTTLTPQATMKCYGLESVSPGDNISVVIPRQEIVGIYKVLQLSQKIKPWFSSVIIEKEEIGTAQLMRRRIQKETQLQQADNPYNLDFSFNMFFNDYSELSTYSLVSVANGALKLSGGTSGSAKSVTTNTSSSVTSVYLKVIGSNLDISTFRVSLDAGSTWQNVSRDTFTLMTLTSGSQLQLEINLNSNSENPNPQVDSISLLYS